MQGGNSREPCLGAMDARRETSLGCTQKCVITFPGSRTPWRLAEQRKLKSSDDVLRAVSDLAADRV